MELHEMIEKVTKVCNEGMSNRSQAWFALRLNIRGKSLLSEELTDWNYHRRDVIPVAYMGNSSYMLMSGACFFLRDCCVTDMTKDNCQKFLDNNVNRWNI